MRRVQCPACGVLAQARLVPHLKKLRWALLKNRRNWTPAERRRKKDLAQSGLASIRAFWLVCTTTKHIQLPTAA
jgi:hypothetical protein